MKKICNAIMRKEDMSRFVMCELEERHKGNHKALMFEWEDMEQIAENDVWFRGLNILKMKVERVMKKKQ